MASQQGAPSRPWFRLATMIRPPTPPPPPPAAPAPSNQGPPPPRPPAFIRPAFTATAPQSTPVGPPPQPTPAQQTSTPTPPPQQRDITPSPPRSTPTPQPPPLPPISTNEVEPTTRDPPSKPPSPPPSTPPSPPKSQSTRDITPPSSPTKTITKSPPPSPRATTNNVVTPPASPPSPRVQKPLVSPPPPSPPKRFRFYTSPPSSPRRPPPMQLPEHPLPPSSPPRTTIETSTTTKPLSPLVLPSLKQKSYNDTPPEYMQKTMHVQEIKEKPMTTTTTTTSATGLLNARGTHTHNSTRSRPETTHKKHWDSEDAGGKNIITIAGENKGAIMNLTPFGEKKHESSHNIHISSRHNPTTSSNDDEKVLETDTKANNKLQNHNNKSNSLLKTAFLNSNVQGINNSILFNSSVNHHDPGIHLTLSAAKSGGGTSDSTGNTRSKNGEHGNII